jgi:beta-glucosidase
MTEIHEERLQAVCADLSLEEKVQLLTGRDFWSTCGVPRIGLRPVVFSDGPSGIRGRTWDERDPSVNLPSPTALSASWDRDLARTYGDVLAVQARERGVDVVLGPTINAHRTPTAGRHFESYSEDPLLTGEIAAAYVDGVQRRGVGATLKHYVCNDFETERFTVDVRVSHRALREVYLAPFEAAVRESHAWLVMSAYNSVNGTTATESDLLVSPLKDEWGFDGVVIGDWTAVRSLASARSGQDLAMPGPEGPWGPALVAAVRAGEVEEALVDDKVVRLLRLAARVGALAGSDAAPAVRHAAPDPAAFAREVASAGSVLLENDGLLPVAAGSVARVLVVGHGAAHPRTQGGGSATVVPAGVVSPLEGVRAAFPGASVEHLAGVVVEDGLTDLPMGQLTNPETGTPGLRVLFREGEEQLWSEDRRSSNLVWFGGDAPVARSTEVELAAVFRPETTGRLVLGVATVGRVRVLVDDSPVLDTEIEPVGDDLGAALLAPPAAPFALDAVAGRRCRLRVLVAPRHSEGGLRNALGIRLGLLPSGVDDDVRIAEAVAAAATADLVVVVVGSNAELEAEGADRETLALPGRQDDLVAAVAAANPNTVAVVNCGAPVLLPWARSVGAVLQMWFPGQEAGSALAALLTGASEPGGRLPTTWPARESDVPLLRVEPVQGQVRYDEDVHVGHRLWLRRGASPAYPFGHGLGYTTWRIADIEAPAQVCYEDAGAGCAVTVTVTNTGERAGKQVVQLYASRAASAVDRPDRWLIGFTAVVVDAGCTVDVPVRVRPRAWAHFDDGWRCEPGDFTVWAGTSVTETPVSTTVRLVVG